MRGGERRAAAGSGVSAWVTPGGHRCTSRCCIASRSACAGTRARAVVLGEAEAGWAASASKKSADSWLKMACLMWLLPALGAAATSWRGDEAARGYEGAPGDAGWEAAWGAWSCCSMLTADQ